MKLGEALRRARFEKGRMTQAQCGAIVGASRHTIMLIEHGDVNPKWLLVSRIAKVMGISLDQLTPSS